MFNSREHDQNYFFNFFLPKNYYFNLNFNTMLFSKLFKWDENIVISDYKKNTPKQSKPDIDIVGEILKENPMFFTY
tara:strand:- start:96 stop:323 length:228 start_codon:yes stop_codon:yes gene_type:complete